MLRKAVLGALAAVALLPTSAALADFPYEAADPEDRTTWRLPGGAGQTPNDLRGKLEWMYAATPEPDAAPLDRQPARARRRARRARRRRGRRRSGRGRPPPAAPDVTIAVLDSGIKWNDRGAMLDLRQKTRISTGEAPAAASRPLDAARGRASTARPTRTTGLRRQRRRRLQRPRLRVRLARRARPGERGRPTFDAGDGVASPASHARPAGRADRVHRRRRRRRNGYADDMVGWDFLDDDNDPYDDVQYGHGTGEARDSTAEADNVRAPRRRPADTDLGTCPNCMAIHMRVGDSFVADVNRFAQATIYAADNDVLVVQEALGTLNKSRLGRDAVEYAYDHGVTVDRVGRRRGRPAPQLAVVVSARDPRQLGDAHRPGTPSYLQFNGCTNFTPRSPRDPERVVLVGRDRPRRGHGRPHLQRGAERARGRRPRPAPDLHARSTGSRACVSAGEVRQLMASGILDGDAGRRRRELRADPAGQSHRAGCSARCPVACTDPFAARADRTRLATSPPRSYPARARATTSSTATAA